MTKPELRHVVVCGTEDKSRLKDSDPWACEKCGKTVLFSKATQCDMSDLGVAFIVLCIQCADPIVANPQSEHRVGPHTAQEVKDHIEEMTLRRVMESKKYE